jgi:hypothetical protein
VARDAFRADSCAGAGVSDGAEDAEKSDGEKPSQVRAAAAAIVIGAGTGAIVYRLLCR